MSSAIFALRKCLNLRSITSARRYGQCYPDYRCDAHMNELPIPCGPWECLEKERQSFYTKHLVLGAAWWVFSFAMFIYTEAVFLNWNPPSMPSPPSDTVEMCEDEN